MGTELERRNEATAVEALIVGGDLSRLSPEQKVVYYHKVCETVGLNPLTKPFDYLRLSGKEVLYANKGCAEQLRANHKISIKIVSCQKIDDIYVVVAEATGPDGRTDSSTGAVPVGGLKGEALANAMLKSETKAKRRVTLSICGLNMLDETEVDSIEGIKKAEAIQAETRALPPIPGVGVEASDFIIRPKRETAPPIGNIVMDYIIPDIVRPLAGKRMHEVGAHELLAAVEWVTAYFEREKREPNGRWAEFLRAAKEAGPLLGQNGFETEDDVPDSFEGFHEQKEV